MWLPVLHQLCDFGLEVVVVNDSVDYVRQAVILNCSCAQHRSITQLVFNLYQLLIINNILYHHAPLNHGYPGASIIIISSTLKYSVVSIMDPFPSSPQQIPLLALLEKLVVSCRQSIRCHSSSLPVYYFSQQIDPATMRYSLQPQEQFILNTISLGKLTRLLEIATVCMANIREGKTITKRNLFYKLQQYYSDYATVDKDIRVICQNLYYIYHSQVEGRAALHSITKNMLGVVASNKCLVFGRADLNADDKTLCRATDGQVEVVTVPTCNKIRAKCMVSKIIIVQKESFFYELVSVFKHYKLYDRYLLITGRGYPDQNTRELLVSLSMQTNPEIETIYYLGDYDIYGIDIFLFYGLGDWSCQGIFDKIQLIQLGSQSSQPYFNQLKLKEESTKFSKEDHRKIKEVQQRLNKIGEVVKLGGQPRTIEKVTQFIKQLNLFVENGSKSELELFNECAWNRLWVHDLIKQKQSTTA